MIVAVNFRQVRASINTGIGRYCELLYSELLRIAGDSEILLLKPKSQGTRPDKISVAGIFFDLTGVNGQIRRHHATVFHGPANILPLRRVRGTRYVVTVHDLSFKILPDQYPMFFRVYFSVLVKRAMKSADIIIAISESTRQDILKYYPSVDGGKIRVVYQGVDDDFSLSRIRDRVISEKYCLSVATHGKRKNVEGTMKALAASPQLSHIKLVVVGNSDSRQGNALRALAESLGFSDRLIVKGYVHKAELVSLYQNAEFLVFPSYYEGFGFPVLEAMACGCPVITSNSSSLREIMPDAEWLVDPNVTTDIRERMERLDTLSSEERSRLVQRNFEHSHKFTWERTARKTLMILQSLAQ